MMKEHTSTKLKLLQVLKKQHTSTMREIMPHFSISEIAVRKHMNVLLREGFIQEEAVKQDIGRPYYVYTLTKKGHQTFPNHFEQLPVELLQDLEEVQGREAVTQVLEKRMHREIDAFKEALRSDDFDGRMEEIARMQDENGYMVEFVKQEDGSYEMRNYHCPIINISSKYREICANEKQTFSEIFPKSKVLAHTCITEGDHVCTWTISSPKQGEGK